MGVFLSSLLFCFIVLLDVGIVLVCFVCLNFFYDFVVWFLLSLISIGINAFLFMFLFFFVRLSVYPLVCLRVHLSPCLSVCLPVLLSPCLFVCIPVCLSSYLCIYLSVCLFYCLFIYLSVSLSVITSHESKKCHHHRIEITLICLNLLPGILDPIPSLTRTSFDAVGEGHARDSCCSVDTDVWGDARPISLYLFCLQLFSFSRALTPDSLH